MASYMRDLPRWLCGGATIRESECSSALTYFQDRTFRFAKHPTDELRFLFMLSRTKAYEAFLCHLISNKLLAPTLL
jgi:hypothetical protein